MRKIEVDGAVITVRGNRINVTNPNQKAIEIVENIRSARIDRLNGEEKRSKRMRNIAKRLRKG